METINPTAVEARARRAARKAGLRAEKSRVRNPHWNNEGGWMLIDATNTVRAGDRYQLTAEEVIKLCKGRMSLLTCLRARMKTGSR